MAAPSQDQNSGRDLPEPRSASAQLAPWLYLGALLGSGWLLFMHPATRVLRAEQDGRRYGLLLPQTHIAPELGRDHRDRCLRELALFGIAPEDRA